MKAETVQVLETVEWDKWAVMRRKYQADKVGEDETGQADWCH